MDRVALTAKPSAPRCRSDVRCDGRHLQVLHQHLVVFRQRLRAAPWPSSARPCSRRPSGGAAASAGLRAVCFWKSCIRMMPLPSLSSLVITVSMILSGRGDLRSRMESTSQENIATLRGAEIVAIRRIVLQLREAEERRRRGAERDLHGAKALLDLVLGLLLGHLLAVEIDVRPGVRADRVAGGAAPGGGFPDDRSRACRSRRTRPWCIRPPAPSARRAC